MMITIIYIYSLFLKFGTFAKDYFTESKAAKKKLMVNVGKTRKKNSSFRELFFQLCGFLFFTKINEACA